MIKTEKTTLARINRMLTAKYAGIQGMYYGTMAPLSAFASAFLLFKGFTNAQIGLVIALGAIGTTALQLGIGSFVGQDRRISIRKAASTLLIISLALSGTLCVVNAGTGVTMAIYVATLIFFNSLPPLINSMNFLYQDRGISLNFGVARAAGSIAYAVLSPVIGAMVLRHSAAVVPWFSLLTIGGTSTFIAVFQLPKILEAKSSTQAGTAPKTTELASGFFRRNKGYLVFLVGLALIFMNNASIQTYLLQIILSKGGNSANLGVTASIGAAMEIPMMLGFAWLLRRIKCSSLIQISTLFMTLKAVAILIAPNMGFLYLAQLLHMLGFAMFTPASVYYVNQLMAEGDQVRGQAYLGSISAIGGIVANFAGGRILDMWEADTMMLLFISLSAIGTVVVFLAVRFMKKGEVLIR